MKEKIPPHEADKLALELEKDMGLVKRFGVKGSFVIMMTSVFLLVVAVLYVFVYLKNNQGKKFTDVASVIQQQNADAAFGWENRGSSGTISGYKTAPATPTGQTNPSTCPVATVVLSKANLAVGESTSVSAPAGWNQGGSFHVTNPAVLSISGNTITALAAGNSQVYGNDFLVGNAFPCTADAMSVTVVPVGTPVPPPPPTTPPPPAIQAYIGGYYIISNCMGRSATITAMSPVPAQIYFEALRSEGGTSSSAYSGPRTVQLSRQSDGVYKGSLTVTTSHFGAGLAAIFRLTGYSGYAAVSHNYDNQCN